MSGARDSVFSYQCSIYPCCDVWCFRLIPLRAKSLGGVEQKPANTKTRTTNVFFKVESITHLNVDARISHELEVDRSPKLSVLSTASWSSSGKQPVLGTGKVRVV